VLAMQFPGVKFVVAGSRVPKFASYYQTIEAEARNRGIDLLGEMASDQVPDFLRTATVALLPYPSGASFRRGSLLAPAACGVPIVSLRGSETPPEIMGLLEPVSSRDELVAQAAAYLSDRAKREAAHEKSRQLAALVSWDCIGGRYVEVLRDLTKRRLSS
jgi:glycosyltransferase involved in cell wall biosynthesis